MPNNMTVTEFARSGGHALARSRTPEQRSEAARRAAEARWARVRAQVAASRRGQGLPDHVTGPVLDQLAARVLDQEEVA